MDHVGALIGIDLTPYHARVDPHRTGAKDYKAFFNRRTADQVRAIYQLDFEKFGYSLDVPAG